jgi:hypothetical protein
LTRNAFDLSSVTTEAETERLERARKGAGEIMTPYDELKQRLAHGWNTWNTRSVLSHVLLPSGFALNLCLKEYADGQYLKEALIGGRAGTRNRSFLARTLTTEPTRN